MEDLRGKFLGNFEIIKKLGSGGMADVYLAHQETIDRYVAIKLLNPQNQSQTKLREHFQQEARSIAKLSHKYILPLYDFGYDNELEMNFIVMPYLRGGTLEEEISSNNRQLSMQEISKILYHIGSALDYAHKKGIIHRDVKCSNILKDEHGDYFLSDFGIAKNLHSDKKITEIGKYIGTPHYMSPEQCRGESHLLSPVSDVYSLGVVLFEMLTHQLPYDAETHEEIVYSHIHKAIPNIRDFRPTLHESFQTLINKSLAKEPENRFQTCKDLENAFDNIINKVLKSPTPVLPKQEQDETIYDRNEMLKRLNEAPQSRVPQIVTGPLGYLNLIIVVPDKNISELAQIQKSVIARDFLEKACQTFKISTKDRTFRYQGQELDLDRTLEHNTIPQKATLELVKKVPEEPETIRWIRDHQQPLPFEAYPIIYLVEEDNQTRFKLSYQPAIIGRADNKALIPHINNFLAVDLTPYDRDVHVSRQHAAITRQKGQYYVENLNKANRTYLNGNLLRHNQRYPIQAGNRIKVGKITLIFQIL